MNSIQEKVREMRLRWYGHIKRMEENNKVRAVADIIVPGKRPRERERERKRDRERDRERQETERDRERETETERDGWIVSEVICRKCGSPRRMPRTEQAGNQEFGPLTPPSGIRRRRKEEEKKTVGSLSSMTSTYMQCAAVSTQRSLKMEPPHMCSSSSIRKLTLTKNTIQIPFIGTMVYNGQWYLNGI